jgi:glutamyl endopeptidase
MAKNPHESVSSESQKPQGREGTERGAGSDADHQSVSGESNQDTQEDTDGVDQVVPDHQGEPKTGELEFVPDFDPTHALTEGMPHQFVTEELSTLRPAEETEFFQPESVCGHDDRVQVTGTTVIPWRWICQLIITMPNGAGFRGTGWFIGPRCVMTAGHCVYSKSNSGWARRIEVIPGMNGAARPYGSSVGTNYRSVNGWVNNTDPNFDYGCIILPNPLGNVVGYFGFANLSDSSLNNLMANNSGYPGDKPFGTQWFNAGRVSSITARKIYYMLDTYGGQSGSPVWRFLNNQRHAVGIHAYGGCPNSATRINTPVYNNMLAWRNL